MRRYFEQVIETSGLYNTAGFNDDTRAFLSIPSRHQVWRQASADWLADLVHAKRIDEHDAYAMMGDLAYHLAKRAYRMNDVPL
jgi:glucuronate isomerase